MTFGVKGGLEGGKRFYDALKLVKRLVNIGDAKSLACHPASTTHRQMSAEEQLKAGVKTRDDTAQYRHRTRPLISSAISTRLSVRRCALGLVNVKVRSGSGQRRQSVFGEPKEDHRHAPERRLRQP
jgi:hypothetical protein